MIDKYKKNRNKKLLLKDTSRLSSANENLVKYSEKHFDLLNKNVLQHALKHLYERKKKKFKLPVMRECNKNTEYTSEARTDHQIKLRSRQLPNVVHELRKAIIRQDWDETALLVMILCHPGLQLYSTIIIKTCFLLLFNHPKSNFELVQNFVRHMTGYLLEEDVNKFMRILFTLRKSALSPLGSGKFIRKTSDYKVTKDPEFEEL